MDSMLVATSLPLLTPKPNAQTRESFILTWSLFPTVSNYVSSSLLSSTFLPDTESSPLLALVQHSKNKDQFLKVAIKRMAETQLFEDELKEVNELNSIPFKDK
jgi:hypothetical protein